MAATEIAIETSGRMVTLRSFGGSENHLLENQKNGIRGRVSGAGHSFFPFRLRSKTVEAIKKLDSRFLLASLEPPRKQVAEQEQHKIKPCGLVLSELVS